ESTIGLRAPVSSSYDQPNPVLSRANTRNPRGNACLVDAELVEKPVGVLFQVVVEIGQVGVVAEPCDIPLLTPTLAMDTPVVGRVHQFHFDFQCVHFGPPRALIGFLYQGRHSNRTLPVGPMTATRC